MNNFLENSKKYFSFDLLKLCGNCRYGCINLGKKKIETPVFMPVGTYGSIKSILENELFNMKYYIILNNSLHIYLKPGIKIIKKQGGLHKFTYWKSLILTDSGGFQIFSLNKNIKIKKDGILFKKYSNGRKIFLTPEKSVQIQKYLKSDINMIFDECNRYFGKFKNINIYKSKKSMELSLEWAIKSKNEFDKINKNKSLFGIIQGGTFEELRKKSLKNLLKLVFDGYAIGGLSVGETKKQKSYTINNIINIMPKYLPRYLMGSGTPEDIISGIEKGIDMFDCVIPTRSARNGLLFTRYGNINIKNKKYSTDKSNLDSSCNCYTCKNFSRSYLHHIQCNNDFNSIRLNTIHNLQFYNNFIEEIRNSIIKKVFKKWKYNFLKNRKKIT